MMKHIKVLKVTAAALAASVVLASGSAIAQPLAGGPRGEQQNPPLFSGQDYRNDRDWNDRDDRRGDNDWRRRKPDFQTIQRDCSRAGIQEAWNRNYYSAQYHDAPRLVEGRGGWEMRGRMRLHDRKGYSYVDTVCDVSRNGNVRIDFRR